MIQIQKDKFLRNQYQTIDEGIKILQTKCGLMEDKNCFIPVCFLYDDCCDLSGKLLNDGVSEDEIKNIFPGYYEY